jgi:hypothetical protein
MDKYSKWVRNKYREAVVKEKMMYDENGTLQELTEKKWDEEVSRLANRAMVPNEQESVFKLVNYRFNWEGNNEVREDDKKFKSEHMPVEKNITFNFKDPHRANSQACSVDEFNFAFPISEWAALATTIQMPLDA